MNYFHAVREKKEELERAAAVAAREQHQQQQPPPADWRRRPQGRLPHQTDGPAAAVATTGEREKWDLSAFLHRSLPGVAEAELARYEAGLRAEGFGDGCGGLLVHLREGDLAQWKKAHARAFLAAVRREVGGDAEGGKS